MKYQSPPAPSETGEETEPFATASSEPDDPKPLESASTSLTYEPFYGLQEKPFSLSSDPRFLYRSPTHAPAFEELLSGIRRREGLIVLTGEIGTGKTTLIRSVLQHLDQRTFTAFVPDPFVSREDLLKVLLVDFGVVSVADLKRGILAGASRPELSYPLYEFLDSLVPLKAFAVLIIDEAQNLPLPLLEEIRVLSDLEQREKLLQVVLVGQPELRTNLKLPEMRQVDQRVSVRCELSPLGRDEVTAYINHRLTFAGHGDSRVRFSDAAIDAVFARTAGVPRLINLICDRSLQRGHLGGAYVIGPQHVTDAIASLGLGAPPSAPVVVTSTSPAPPASGRTRQAQEDVVRVRVIPPDVPPTLPKPPRAPEAAIAPIEERLFLDEFAAESELASARAEEEQVADAPAREPRSRWIGMVLLLVGLAIAVTWLMYSASRSIDLNAGALPSAPAGTDAEVSAAPRPPAADDALRAVSSAGSVVEDADRFAIQVASFQSRARADRLVQELVDAGLRPRIVEFDLGPPRGLVLQVRIDGYSSADDAGRDLTRIRELPGYDDARLLAR